MRSHTYWKFFLLAVIVSVASPVARAGDREFDAVVGHIKKHYHGAKQNGFPFGLARLAVKFAHPAGVKSLRIAVFEHLSGTQDNAGLDALLREQLADGWEPIVRVFSRKDREQTYVYSRPKGDDMELFVVVVDGEDATVAKAQVDVDSLTDWILGGAWSGGDTN
jgi:hypothetical protein